MKINPRNPNISYTHFTNAESVCGAFEILMFMNKIFNGGWISMRLIENAFWSSMNITSVGVTPNDMLYSFKRINILEIEKRKVRMASHFCPEKIDPSQKSVEKCMSVLSNLQKKYSDGFVPINEVRASMENRKGALDENVYSINMVFHLYDLGLIKMFGDRIKKVFTT